MLGKAVARGGTVFLLIVLALSAVFWNGSIGPKPATSTTVSAKTLSVSGTFSTGFQVQNLSSTSKANIQITYYNTDGTLAASVQTDSIDPGVSKSYYGSSLLAPSNFKGSAVVQSDQQIAVVVNELVSNPSMLSSYVGVNAPATTVNLPLVMKANGGFDTKIYIQNAGSANASSIQVKFYKAGESTATTTKSPSSALAPGGVYELDQSTMTELTAAWVGSVTITSDQPVAAVVNQSNGKQLLTYTGFSAGAQMLYAPLVMTANSGFYAGVQAQNVSASTITATLKVFDLSGNTVRTDPVSLAANVSKSWYPVTTGGTRFVGSATVEASSGSSLVGIVNQLNASTNQGTASGLFSTGTNKVVAPLIQTANSDYNAGFQVQNTSSSAVTVTLSTQATSGTCTPVDTTEKIEPGASWSLYPVTTSGVKCVGSATVSGPSGAQLVGVVNQLNQAGGAVDLFSTYEGVNQ